MTKILFIVTPSGGTSGDLIGALKAASIMQQSVPDVIIEFLIILTDPLRHPQAFPNATNHLRQTPFKYHIKFLSEITRVQSAFSEFKIKFRSNFYIGYCQLSNLKKVVQLIDCSLESKIIFITEYNQLNHFKEIAELEQTAQIQIIKSGFGAGYSGVFTQDLTQDLTQTLESLNISENSLQKPLFFGYVNLTYAKSAINKEFVNKSYFAELAVKLAFNQALATSTKLQSITILLPLTSEEYCELQELLNNTSAELSQDYSYNAQILINLINPYPLNKDQISWLMLNSHPFCLLTGDQSFIEGLMHDKVPLYEIMSWKFSFYKALLAECGACQDSSVLEQYFTVQCTTDVLVEPIQDGDLNDYNISMLTGDDLLQKTNQAILENIILNNIVFENLQRQMLALKEHVLNQYNLNKTLPIIFREMLLSEKPAKLLLSVRPA